MGKLTVSIAAPARHWKAGKSGTSGLDQYQCQGCHCTDALVFIRWAGVPFFCVYLAGSTAPVVNYAISEKPD